MFAAPFVALVLASAALAGPMKRDGALTVELSGPANVASVDDLKFSATVKNTGSDAVKILKYATILDETLPTRSFKVTKDGEEVPFTGIKVSIDLEAAGESAYTVIPAGESITVNHDVGSLFDFATVGAGNFKFEPLTEFHLVDSEASFVESEVEVNSNALEVAVTKAEKRELEKRARNACTNASQTSFINSAYSEGKSMASAAASYIGSNGANTLYTQYFKTNPTSTVRNVFTTVANENSSTRTLNCNDALGACTSGVIAYTVISTTNVYFCSIFFQEVSQNALCTGQTTVANRNIRGATVLHELTHAVSGTTDVTYGCAADRALAASSQVRNADNYNSYNRIHSIDGTSIEKGRLPDGSTINNGLFVLLNPFLSLLASPSPLYLARAGLRMAQTRPLRRPTSSSPLTGPSVSADGTIVSQGIHKDRPKPSRIKSSPDLQAAARKIPARPSSSQGSTHGRHRASVQNFSSFSSFNVTTARPSTATSTPSAPARPPRSILRESRQQMNMACPLPIPRSPPSFMPAAYHRPNRSVPIVPSDWLMSNTYAEVPRFSRMSLASADVVLPLRAKKHRRHSSLTTRFLVSTPNSQPAWLQFGRKERELEPEEVQSTTTLEDGGEPRTDEEPKAKPPDFRASFQSNFHDDFRLSIKPRKGANPLRTLRQEDFLANRQSLYSTPLSPDSLEMEFSMIAEEGEERGFIVLSPYTEKLFSSFGRKGIRPIAIPSVPVDIDIETPISPTYPNRMSVRRHSARSRTHSFGSLTPKRKPSLKQRKSLASLKAHKRAISKADSILAPTNPFAPTDSVVPKGHRKGASFLSFHSSDGSEWDEIDPDVTDIEEVSDEDGSDHILSHKRSIDTFSIESDDLREAEQLLTDILALPTYGVRRNTLSSLPPSPPSPPQQLRIPPLSRPQLARARSSGPVYTVPPPTSKLPPVPLPTTSQLLPSSTQYRGFEFPAVPTPSVVRTRGVEVIPQRTDSLPIDVPRHLASNVAQQSRKVPELKRMSPLRPGTSASYREPSIPPADELAHLRSCSEMDNDTSSLSSAVTVKPPSLSKAIEILGMDESDAASVCSATTVGFSTSRASDDSDYTLRFASMSPSRGSSAKAISLLGIGDEPPSSSRRRQYSSAKALERLGLYGDDGGNYIHHGPSSIRSTSSADKGKNESGRKQGGVKKLWKTLTKGSVRGGPTP
ncbi:hypothetical protein PQX77_016611 [Marasmius sp. AFHP31]|nr:hypothetical protein PQX77_016611 [Marasmius sp. AFHP31]